MRHHNTIRKFGRVKNQREALLRSLARALIIEGKIVTTEAKAKELRPFIEKLVTKAKQATLVSRRLIIARLGGGGKKKPAKMLIDDIAPKYKNRPGGYTRIIKMMPRKSDASKMAVIEFV
ncbi:MAG: 50S ribosomal protein L17 [Candidatus Lloydbacteria bacterium]|nr:50S ribosomal protein L17 [Candidatus Lloydbacteria bacterium]